MNILVTGSEGFIAKNLIERLNRIENLKIFSFSKEDNWEILTSNLANIDFIFHLAGVNRPQEKSEFYEGNRDLSKKLLEALEKNHKKIPILLSSSTQALMDNDYGKSKKESETLITAYATRNNVPAYIYRLPNVFGKWCRPNYNSVIATWCHNISHNIPLKINDKNAQLTLTYIDDVVEHFVEHLFSTESTAKFCEINTVYQRTLGEISNLLEQFKANRHSLKIPAVGQGFERALYATYLSYLPTDQFSYELKGHCDERGTFYEILKTFDSGQFSISTTNPGDIMRGEHYHNTKNEKFLVIKGTATIELRQIHSHEVIEYKVNDKKMEVVEMIPGYTHNIKNTSDEVMILLIWANEVYNHDKPDTNYLKV
ncbi:MAG: Nucleoside-diphosphate-sugar epimerases [uncultured Sulfurovum sp.]|uniref:Nucleoside-diphosphate-sugar epimerases n=1 Tax=uncultured Sulfurovum sp. TaxID=269237 RepID=A0A6S6SPX1_9BACT|nr:MAG: Nucleoside-diphosphate-sugar epimerases [uncultured Sulfurovum sp.]